MYSLRLSITLLFQTRTHTVGKRFRIMDNPDDFRVLIIGGGTFKLPLTPSAMTDSHRQATAGLRLLLG